MRPQDKVVLKIARNVLVVIWLTIFYLVYIQGFVKSLPHISIPILLTMMYFLCKAQAKIDANKPL